MKSYVNKLANFERGVLQGVEVNTNMIQSKVLTIAVQPGKMTFAQSRVIRNVTKYAKSLDVKVNIVKIK